MCCSSGVYRCVHLKKSSACWTHCIRGRLPSGEGGGCPNHKETLCSLALKSFIGALFDNRKKVKETNNKTRTGWQTHRQEGSWPKKIPQEGLDWPGLMRWLTQDMAKQGLKEWPEHKHGLNPKYDKTSTGLLTWGDEVANPRNDKRPGKWSG